MSEPASEPEPEVAQPAQEPKDIFSVCKKNVDKFFTEIEKSTPRYQQSVQKIQQDYLVFCFILMLEWKFVFVMDALRSK